MDARHKTQDARRNTKYERRTTGSAIILAVVLTSLLAIVGAIFLLSSRVDSVATSAIADNKDLNLAVDTVIAHISEALALDVPRADANGVPVEEYYDYPDPCNPWLACLEPYSDAGIPRWRQVSNIYGSAIQNIEARVLPDYNDILRIYTAADADGDGVGDSMWVQVAGKTSSKGKPIYAAIRVVDNSAMLNVNTGYKFVPTRSVGASQMDVNLFALSGRDNTYSATQKENRLLSYRCGSADANLYEQNVVWQYGPPFGAYTPFDVSDELKLRNRYILNYNLMASRIETLWTNAYEAGPRVPLPSTSYPFSRWPDCTISGINPGDYDYRHISTTYSLDRIIAPDGNRMFNINSASAAIKDNVHAAVLSALDPNMPNYRGAAAQIAANLIDYVDADDKVTVVDDVNSYLGFEQPCIYISEFAQNFYQPDSNNTDPNTIERSYAIELYKPYVDDLPAGLNEFRLIIGANPPLYFDWTGSTWFHVFLNDAFNRINVDFNNFTFTAPKPFNGEIVDINNEPNLLLEWNTISAAASYNVYLGTDQNAVFAATPNDLNVFQNNVSAPTTTFNPPPLDVNTTYFWRIEALDASDEIITRGLVWRFTISDIRPFYTDIQFVGGDLIYLQRRVPALGLDVYVTVDAVLVPVTDTNTGWLDPVIADPNDPDVRAATYCFQRDIFPHKPIRRLWDISFGFINLPSVGTFNSFVGDPPQVQAHPANQTFTNVGQFGELFYAPTYDYGGIGPNFFIPVTDETELRINLVLPEYQRLFNYLTVIDPINYGHTDAETRIKGRININTAPWFVIAQLPWITDGTPSYELAQAIVAYRDKLNLLTNVVDYSGGRGRGIVDLTGNCQPAPGELIVREDRGFANIGELMNVTHGLRRELCPLLTPPLYNPLYDIRKYATNGTDLGALPDLTTPDLPSYPLGGAGAIDDFEERDVIFARISNLVTVRSDIFTAYILVRIGETGPQKRVVAILDRSESPAKPVKVLAIQSVPDPR